MAYSIGIDGLHGEVHGLIIGADSLKRSGPATKPAKEHAVELGAQRRRHLERIFVMSLHDTEQAQQRMKDGAELIHQTIPDVEGTEPRLSKEIVLLIGSCEAIAKNARDRSDQRRIGYDGYNAAFDSGYASALEHVASRLLQIQKQVGSHGTESRNSTSGSAQSAAQKTPDRSEDEQG